MFILKYLLLIVGFFLLIKGADYFVDGSSSIAGILKIPSVIIGLTIVAMGTSAPEAAVSVTAAIEGSSAISLGNIIGSNIFNLLMVIGISAVIKPMPTNGDILKRDLWWNIGATVVLMLCILNRNLGRIEGIILLAGMIIYIIILIRNAKKNHIEEDNINIMSVPKSIIFIIIGLAGVIFGGQLVVDNAKKIALEWGMSETLVGLTIVAIGTSLPELVTSIVASNKGNSGIALGNAIGSCIFNIMFILGTSALIKPIDAASELITDTFILIGVCVLILVFAVTKKQTNRIEGLLCVLGYIAYSAFIILR